MWRRLSSGARSLWQLLSEMRPQWLRSRGVDVLAPRPDPLKTSGVRVYLNGELLGGLDTLDEVMIDAVTRIEFLDATGIDSRTHVLPEVSSEEDVLRLVHQLNQDPSVHGILVQAPLASSGLCPSIRSLHYCC